MRIESARPEQVSQAVACLVAAFTCDPLMSYFFPGGAEARAARTAEFFSLLLRVRMALRMPAIVATEDRNMLGVVMGYDTRRPDWPAPFTTEWDAFLQEDPEITGRFDAYETVSQAGLPAGPHYYLGVIGVADAGRGRGLGRELLRAFCLASEGDPGSSGVYLETANPANVPFYEKHGFRVSAEGSLGPCRLWCMYRAQGPRGGTSDA